MNTKNFLLSSIISVFGFFIWAWLFPANTFAVSCGITSSSPYYIGSTLTIDATGMFGPPSTYDIELQRIVGGGLDIRNIDNVNNTTPMPHSIILSSPPADTGTWEVWIIQTGVAVPDIDMCGNIDIGPPPIGCPALNCIYSEPDASCASGIIEVSGCRYGDPDCPTSPVYPVGQCVFAGPGCSTYACYVSSGGSCSVSPVPPAGANVSGSGLDPLTNYRILLNGTPTGGGTTDSSGSFTSSVSTCAAANYLVQIQKMGSASTIDCGNFTSTGCPIGRNPCRDTNADGKVDKCETALGDLDIEPPAFASAILTLGLGIAGGIALILMVIGSVRVLTSSGDQNRLNAGRDMIVAAVAGLLFLIFCVMILRFIGFNILGLP